MDSVGDHRFPCRRRFWISFKHILLSTKGQLLTFSRRLICTPMIEPWKQSLLSLQRDGKKCPLRHTKPIEMFVNGARILIQFFSSQLDDVDRRAPCTNSLSCEPGSTCESGLDSPQSWKGQIITTEPCSPSLEIIFYFREIIPKWPKNSGEREIFSNLPSHMLDC